MKKAEIIAIYAKNKKKLSTLQKLNLLKEIENISNDEFKNHPSLKKYREILGIDEKSIYNVEKAVLQGDFEGIKEYSKEFNKVLRSSFTKQELTKQLIVIALKKVKHGYSKFDKQLILGSIKIAKLYDNYYKEWYKAIRSSKAAKLLIKYQKRETPEYGKVLNNYKLMSHYTIIDIDQKGGLKAVPYYQFFYKEMLPITYAFEDLINKLLKISNISEVQKRIIEYLKKYKDCLTIINIDEMESAWKELDEIWVNIKYSIEIVYDIEYGYGDPLCTKVIPDFSIRFVDDSYEKENKEIELVHKSLIKFYENRNTEISIMGKFSLGNSYAAIYYIPFVCGMSHHFRFSGHCLPNRTEVSSKFGIKIYFDVVATRLRVLQVKNLIKSLFGTDKYEEWIDPVKTIVEHVSAHEFGHSIYGLDNLLPEISSTTKSLLEEPRAELTALTILLYRNQTGLFSDEKLEKSLFSFMASDLRRFVMYDSPSIQSYLISALNTYNIYEKVGYLKIENDILKVDLRKSKDVLIVFKDQLIEILNAEDERNVEFLEKVLNNMRKECDLVKWILKKLKIKSE